MFFGKWRQQMRLQSYRIFHWKLRSLRHARTFGSFVEIRTRSTYHLPTCQSYEINSLLRQLSDKCRQELQPCLCNAHWFVVLRVSILFPRNKLIYIALNGQVLSTNSIKAPGMKYTCNNGCKKWIDTAERSNDKKRLTCAIQLTICDWLCMYIVCRQKQQKTVAGGNQNSRVNYRLGIRNADFLRTATTVYTQNDLN